MPAVRLEVARVESRNTVYVVIENTPGDIFACNADLRVEIREPVNLHIAVRCGNHLGLHSGSGYYTLHFRLPNDEGSEGVDDEFQGGFLRVCFSPQVFIGVAQD